MKITVLVENTTENKKLKTIHGLSLLIETTKHKILFDLGPDKTLFKNAQELNIDLNQIDIVIISHGHIDHGGALKEFLKINNHAKIYIQRQAFEKHYLKLSCFFINIGLDSKLILNNNIILLDGNYQIDEDLSLFTVNDISKCYSPMNNILYSDSSGGKKIKDNFIHEQNLIIHDFVPVVIIGCGHTGIVNIMNYVKDVNPKIIIGGYHLNNNLTKASIPQELIDEIVEYLNNYPYIDFFTCHCTGKEIYQYIASKMNNMHYLKTGDYLELETTFINECIKK